MVPTVQRHSSLFAAGLHKEREAGLSGTPAAGLTRVHTQMQSRNTPWKMQRKAETAEAKGFP